MSEEMSEEMTNTSTSNNTDSTSTGTHWREETTNLESVKQTMELSRFKARDEFRHEVESNLIEAVNQMIQSQAEKGRNHFVVGRDFVFNVPGVSEFLNKHHRSGRDAIIEILDQFYSERGFIVMRSSDLGVWDIYAVIAWEWDWRETADDSRLNGNCPNTGWVLETVDW